MGAAGAPGAARRAAGAGRAAGTTSDAAAAASAVGRIRARRFRRVTLAARRGDIMPKRKVTPGPASPRPRPPRPRHDAACCGPPSPPGPPSPLGSALLGRCRPRRRGGARRRSQLPAGAGEAARRCGRSFPLPTPGGGGRREAAGGGGEPRSERAAPFAPPTYAPTAGPLPPARGPSVARGRGSTPRGRAAGGASRGSGPAPARTPPFPRSGGPAGAHGLREGRPGGRPRWGCPRGLLPVAGARPCASLTDNCGPVCQLGQPESFVAAGGPRIPLRPVSTPLNKATG